MSFWSFIRDMLVFDWIFEYNKKVSVRKQRQKNSRRYDNQSLRNNYGNGYNNNRRNDYVQQDFDDDPDSGMYGDDF